MNEVTVLTDGPSVDYRQMGLLPSLQMLNPRHKTPFSCFRHHLLLITSVNTGSCEGHLRHRQQSTKQRIPLDCPDTKAVVPICLSVQHPFLTSCTLTSSASEPWKQARPLCSMSALHITPWEGHDCQGVLQAPLPTRRASTKLPVGARANPCPAPLPKQRGVSASTDALLFSLLHPCQCLIWGPK